MRVYGLSKSNSTESHLRHDRRRSGPVVFIYHAVNILAGGGDPLVRTPVCALAFFCGVPVWGEDVLGLRGAGTSDPAPVSCGSVPMLVHLGTLPP